MFFLEKEPKKTKHNYKLMMKNKSCNILSQYIINIFTSIL